MEYWFRKIPGDALKKSFLAVLPYAGGRVEFGRLESNGQERRVSCLKSEPTDSFKFLGEPAERKTETEKSGSSLAHELHMRSRAVTIRCSGWGKARLGERRWK